jgi:hypothetical protein
MEKQQIIHGHARLHMKGRLTEQHDIFFGIGTSVKDLVQNEGFLA